MPVESGSDARGRTLRLLRTWGWNATSFQVLERGFSHFFDGEDACVSYVDTGSAWVVAGAPIAPLSRLAEVTARFVEAGRAAGRRVCFFAVERRFVVATGLSSMHVGEQATWDPQRWGDTLRKRRSLREQLRRARAKGVRIRAVSPSEMGAGTTTRAAVEALVARWLGTREMASMGFLVDVQLFDFAEERRYFVAEKGDSVVGLLAAVPVFARSGWFVEDLLRHPRAPNGTTELLVDHAFSAMASEGSTYATLGLAPLAGAVPPWLRRVRRLSSSLYDFDGIRAFKAKLAPGSWDPILLAYPAGAWPPWALHDVLAAFARGTFVGFGLRTMLRGPSLVVRGLALLLLPWTVVLACAGASWFPTPGVQRAWVIFDVVLAVGLLALSRRWQRWLAGVLVCFLSADVALTWAQAALFNGPRARTPVSWLVLCVACVGPALGAATLWGAKRRHDGDERRVLR